LNHVMVDIESLGTKPGSVILSIGAVKFDETNLGQTFYQPIDVLSCLMAGLKTDPDTIAFWRQYPDMMGVFYPATRIRVVLTDFARYLGRNSCVWAKGPDFDLVLLEKAYDAAGIEELPWHYRNARDVRTVLSLVKHKPEVHHTFPKHHALGDAVLQARQVQEIYRHLGLKLSEELNNGTATAP